MSSLVDDLSEEIIKDALKLGPRPAILKSLIRAAGRMLAETHGEDQVIGVLTSEIRRFAQIENCKGVRRR